jgi:uncharacterized membrane protein YdjX (TVP38/TMEM64 family)
MENHGANTVRIIDFDMPFWSMVTFMVKAAIASIPAFIILSIIGTVVFGLLGGIFGGAGRF